MAVMVYLQHSAKGSTWEDHKYIKRIDGTYYYPDNYEGGRHLPSSGDKSNKEDEEPPEIDNLTENDIDALAKEVIRGNFANGQERKELLGEFYQQVQTRVNQLMKASTGSKSISSATKEEETATKKAVSSTSSSTSKTPNLSEVYSVYEKKKKREMKQSVDETGEEYLAHFGIKRRSGRYPYGSGERPYQSEENRAALLQKKAERREKMKQTAKNVAKGVGKAVWTGVGVALKVVASTAITSATLAGIMAAGFQFLQSPACQEILNKVGIAAGNLLYTNFVDPAAKNAASHIDELLGIGMNYLDGIASTSVPTDLKAFKR